MYNSGGRINTAQYDENAAMILLTHMTQQQLKELHENENKINELIQDLPEFKNLQRERENLLTATKSLADYNMTKQEPLKQARLQLAATYERAVELQKEFEVHKQQFDISSSNQSLPDVLAVLQAETAKIDEQSENTAQAFCNGKMDIDNFLSLYHDQRVLAHLRKVKSEKLDELLRQQSSQQVSYASKQASTPYSGLDFRFQKQASLGGQVIPPYPTTNPYMMPMPYGSK